MGSVTPELIFLKFGKKNSHATSATRPHVSKMVADWLLKKRRGLGVYVKLSVRVLFYFYFFSSFNAPTAYNEKGGLTLNAPKNVFGGKFVPCGLFFRGGNSPLFYPQKPIFYRPIMART